MNPKPFLRPSLSELRDLIPTIARDADSAEELVTRAAFRGERIIKQTITEKGLIDTGTLRASVTAIPLGQALPTADDVDADAAAAARATLEVEGE